MPETNFHAHKTTEKLHVIFTVFVSSLLHVQEERVFFGFRIKDLKFCKVIMMHMFFEIIQCSLRD
jgi:hypothetical protein